MDQNSIKSASWLDGAAVALSGLCLIHCLALPLLVAGLPFLTQFSAGHLHLQMLVIVLPLSVLALAIGFRRHKSRFVIVAGGTGMLLLIVGATVAHTQLGLAADRLFTILGALTLATAHYFNSVRSRSCRTSSG
jgi:hypothetical protein